MSWSRVNDLSRGGEGGGGGGGEREDKGTWKGCREDLQDGVHGQVERSQKKQFVSLISTDSKCGHATPILLYKPDIETHWM